MNPITTSQNNVADGFMNALKANDQQTLKAIYTNNYRKIEQYVRNNQGTEDDARDVYQEAFIAVWRNIQLNRVSFTNTDQLQGYLFKVASYKWLDKIRGSKNKKMVSVDDIDMPAHDADLSNAESDFLEKVKSTYAAMGQPCKDVLHRFYFLKQKMANIAASFSWTEATAKNNKYRCLEKLRNMVLPQKANM